MGLSQGRNTAGVPAPSPYPLSLASSLSLSLDRETLSPSLLVPSTSLLPPAPTPTPLPSLLPRSITRCHYGHYFLLTVLTSVLAKLVPTRALHGMHGKDREREYGSRRRAVAIVIASLLTLRFTSLHHVASLAHAGCRTQGSFASASIKLQLRIAYNYHCIAYYIRNVCTSCAASRLQHRAPM